MWKIQKCLRQLQRQSSMGAAYWFIRLGGRALLRVSIYSLTYNRPHRRWGGGRVYLILNTLLIFLKIVRLLCMLVS